MVENLCAAISAILFAVIFLIKRRTLIQTALLKTSIHTLTSPGIRHPPGRVRGKKSACVYDSEPRSHSTRASQISMAKVRCALNFLHCHRPDVARRGTR